MAIEIEKPSVSFTDEAQRTLQHSLLRLERRIRARAADEAIKSRGTPSEVTGSDIEQAYRELIGRSPSDLFEDRMENQSRHWRRATQLQLMATFYMILGLFLTVCGAIYPFIRSQLQNPSVRLSVMITAGGLFMAAIGLAMRTYLRYREFLRKEESLRRYPRSYRYQRGVD